MKLSETAAQVIALAEAVRNYWDTELPKRHPDYPFAHPGEDSGPPPPEEQQLRDLFARLPPEMVFQLALIVHLGRLNVRTDDLAGGYAKVRERYDTPEEAALIMRNAGALAEDLSDGLAELAKSGIDPDSLMAIGANSVP